MKDSLNSEEVPGGDGVPRPGGEGQVEMQIVEGKQPQTEDFPGPEKVPQIGPGEAARRAGGRFRKAAAGPWRGSRFLMWIGPSSVKAMPWRAIRVGITQSNMSTPRAIISRICGGVPRPMA